MRAALSASMAGRTSTKSVAKDIGEGRWQKYGKEYVLNYCAEDVKADDTVIA